MNKIENNLDNEKKFIELLGYKLFPSGELNKWIIEDTKQDIVGYVQYVELNQNDNKGNKEFGYKTFINSSNILYNSTRKIDEDIFDDLSFDIKEDNEIMEHVRIVNNDFSSIIIWSMRYGFINMKIDDFLYLYFNGYNNGFNLEEVLVYSNNSRYLYQKKKFENGLKISDNKFNARISRDVYNNKNQIIVSSKDYLNGNVVSKSKILLYDSFKDIASNHEDGNDFLNRLIILINNIIPFNEDVMSLIINDDMIRKNELSMYFPLLENDSLKRSNKKIKENNNV